MGVNAIVGSRNVLMSVVGEVRTKRGVGVRTIPFTIRRERSVRWRRLWALWRRNEELDGVDGDQGRKVKPMGTADSGRRRNQARSLKLREDCPLLLCRVVVLSEALMPALSAVYPGTCPALVQPRQSGLRHPQAAAQYRVFSYSPVDLCLGGMEERDDVVV